MIMVNPDDPNFYYFVFIPIVAIIIAMIFNAITYRASTRAQFTTFLNDLSREHSELLLKEGDLSKLYIEIYQKKSDNPNNTELIEKLNRYLEDQCELYALAYMDLLERIAFLCITGKIPKKIAKNFREYFEYVQLIMQYYDHVIALKTNLRTSKERWKNIVEWCSKDYQDIPSDSVRAYLPIPMQEFWDNEFINQEENL